MCLFCMENLSNCCRRNNDPLVSRIFWIYFWRVFAIWPNCALPLTLLMPRLLTLGMAHTCTYLPSVANGAIVRLRHMLGCCLVEWTMVLFSQNWNLHIFLMGSKGRAISEGNCCVLKYSKKQMIFFQIPALRVENGSNQKYKGRLLY